MWVFLTSRLRTWIVFAVALPLATVIIRKIRQTVEARSGPTPIVSALTKLENFGQSRRRRAAAMPTRR